MEFHVRYRRQADFGATTGREADPTGMAAGGFRQRWAKDDHVTTLLNGPRLWAAGAGMDLDNLVRVGSLKPHATSAAEVQRLLGAARRNLADAAVVLLSDESRYDIAYKAIVQCALVGLAVDGYWATNAPGHHETVIQSLPLTLGVSWEEWRVLEGLRRKRDAMEDTGDLIDAASADDCMARAQALYAHLERWLMQHRPELLDP